MHSVVFWFVAVYKDDGSGDAHPPVYFHVSPMEGNDNQVPAAWGYFSFNPKPEENGNEKLMQRLQPSISSMKTFGICEQQTAPCDFFESLLPGVTACV